MGEGLSTPMYTDDLQRERGEALWACWRALQDGEEAREAFVAAARELRQGPLLLPGEIVAERYRLLARIRDGGLAATWRGWDLVSDEPVAIKVLHAQFLADPSAVEQFFGAASRMASLEHPRAPRVRLPRADYEGFQLFVTDFHGETTLEARLTAEPRLDRWAAVQAVIEAGQALATAHAQGLLHQDVNPGAIYLSDDEAWLTDFDLAPPHQLGSAYQAPETMEPGAEASPRSDVYSLGMTLLFALHGQALPFWVLRDPERLISAVDAPEAVKDVLRSALSWDPDERVESVEALLEAVLAPDEVQRALAEAALTTGRTDLAVDRFRALVARDGHPDLRVHLARSLTAVGQLEEASNQLMLALQDDRLEAIEQTLAELRSLSERSGDWGPLLDALEARANDPRSPRDALLLEVARIQAEHGADDPAETLGAWQRALEVHSTRAQAREALQGMLRVHQAHSAWEAYTSVARDLLPLLPRAERGELQHRIGRIYLDELDDQQAGLVWLERAHDSGFEHPELTPTLERIRSARGDWPQLIALMEEQAAGQANDEAVVTLRRAARIARFASQDPDVTRRVYESMAARAGDAEARSWLAAQARSEGEAEAARTHLEGLPLEPGDAPNRWVRDNVELIRLLWADGRLEEARERLTAGLAAQPHHLPTLLLAAAFHTDAGEPAEAEGLWERVLGLLVGTGLPEEREARAALADLAWIHGDLQRALEHGHALVELAPEDPTAWWTVSKVHLWGLRAATEEEPWLRATPLRFTPQEALARLLGGVLRPEAVDAWLRLDPLGAVLADRMVGRPILEMAAVVVDLLERRKLLGPALFERLGEAFPEAGVSIEAVRWLWCEEPADNLFPVAESYRWSMTGMGADFDPRIHRTVLHLQPARSGEDTCELPAHLAQLQGEEAFATLLAREDGEPLPIESAAHGPSTATPQMAMERPRRLVVKMDTPVDGRAALLIEGEQCELGAETGLIELEGVSLHRSGSRVYIVGSVEVEGKPVEELRLRGGERVRVGEVGFQVLLLEGHEPLVLAARDTGVTYSLPEESEEPLVREVPASQVIAVEPLEMDDDDEDDAPLVLGPEGDDLDLGDFIADEDDPTYDLRQPPPALPRAAIFRRHDGSEEMVPFDSELFVIGRDPEDDVVVDLPGEGFVYRLHRRAAGYCVEEALEDGTSEERPLADGESFSVGDSTYVFRVLSPSTPAPPPLRPPSPSLAPAVLRPAPLPVPLLILDDGTPTGKVLQVQRETFTIGRGRKNDLQLAGDAKISRHHCTLVRSADGVVKLRDNSSSNGTYVNGRKIREHVLQEGDTIAVGDHLFEFRLGKSEEEEELPLVVEEPPRTPDHEDSDRTRHPTELIAIREIRKE